MLLVSDVNGKLLSMINILIIYYIVNNNFKYIV